VRFRRTDASHSVLRIKNCSTVPVWIAEDNGMTVYTVWATCVAPGAYRSVVKPDRAGPMKSGQVTSRNCTSGQIGTRIGFGIGSVDWGKQTLGI